MKEKELKEKVGLRVGGLYSHSKVQEAVNKIVDLYQQEGFYNTRIDIDTLYPTIPGRIEISLKVEEGSKIKITRIEFEGNEHFSDAKLQSAISTKARSFIKFWRRGGYDDEKFQKDLTEKLPKFYQKNGFVDLQVLGHKMEFKEASRNVTLRITVDEGRCYYLGDISVSGNAHSRMILFCPSSPSSNRRFSTRKNSKRACRTCVSFTVMRAISIFRLSLCGSTSTA